MTGLLLKTCVMLTGNF